MERSVIEKVGARSAVEKFSNLFELFELPNNAANSASIKCDAIGPCVGSDFKIDAIGPCVADDAKINAIGSRVGDDT
jgi:hypothetical protein